MGLSNCTPPICLTALCHGPLTHSQLIMNVREKNPTQRMDSVRVVSGLNEVETERSGLVPLSTSFPCSTRLHLSRQPVFIVAFALTGHAGIVMLGSGLFRSQTKKGNYFIVTVVILVKDLLLLVGVLNFPFFLHVTPIKNPLLLCILPIEVCYKTARSAQMVAVLSSLKTMMTINSKPARGYVDEVYFRRIDPETRPFQIV